jgi:antitoxin component of MazEF toxin-antitoxin module
MRRKVLKTGNRIVVTLPKEMLDALRLGEGEAVSVELDADHRQPLIAPAPAAAEDIDAEFARQVADFVAAYRPALESLAR